MAKQHFYSRVPAKMSMFNKMDGYDTFAHSEGITREQIENELSSVCDYKPTKEEIALMRDGALPTVYCQFTTASDTMVQSAISFLKSDYTGERSSYTVHSLLLSEKERAERLETPDKAVFCPDVFKTDVSDFNITDAASSPDSNYPEINIPLNDAAAPEDIAEKYDTGMVKRLLYSLIGIPCGKTKALYLALSCDSETFSRDNLAFLNSILLVFPYHMRKAMSFVTYITDTAKFSSFKIKCMSESIPNLPNSKGITLKMNAKDYSGVSDENIAANAMVVDFFYNILKNAEIRKSFLAFCEYAVERDETLRKATLKNLTDLVFIFKVLSGYFEEKTVLPNDDAVYNFVNTYAKYRTALSDDFRSRSMNFLSRYSESGIAIPKNVFAKVCSCYDEEVTESKKTVMEVSLSLIHTDTMREKLFNFIKNCYDGETAETKALIMNSVCRVYYGGFLQETILEFFDGAFETEPTEIRDIILEKLLLTVRTPKVQQSVVGFINRHFDSFNDSQKDKFYSTFYEMLPFADNLSRMLADTVDNHIDESRRDAAERFIVKCLNDEKEQGSDKLCRVLAVKCGFCESVIIKKMFTDWISLPCFEAFLDTVSRKDTVSKANTLKEIFSTLDTVPDEAQAALSDALCKNANTGASVFDLISLSDGLDEFCAQHKNALEFTQKFKENALYPQTAALIPTVFDIKRFPNGLLKLKDLASSHTFIASADEYKLVNEFYEVVSSVKSGDTPGAVIHSQGFTSKTLRLNVAELLKRETADFNLDENMIFTLQMAIGYLKFDTFTFTDAANRLRDTVMSVENEKGASTSEELQFNVDKRVIEMLIAEGEKLYSSDISAELKEKLVSDGCELAKYILSFLNKYDKKGKKWYLSYVGQLSYNEAYLKSLNGFANIGKSGGGFFKKMFRK